MRDLLAVVFLGICVLKGTIDHLTDTRVLDWFRETSDRMQALQVTADKLRSLGASGEEIAYIAADDPAASAEFYYGLQYQMLPTLLLASSQSILIVVHAQDSGRLKTVQEANHLVLLGNAGNGFYLLKREAL